MAAMAASLGARQGPLELRPGFRVCAGMRSLAIVGIVLIGLGIAGLVVQNISFTQQKTVVDAGPLKVTADEEKTVPIPTIAGIAAIVVGLGLVAVGQVRRGR